MINIRPVSDLRNKYPEIEDIVLNSNEPVFLTKNGYGSTVIMSIEQYTQLTEGIEFKLDEADSYAEKTTKRYTANEVFERARKRVNSNERV